jgi:peptidoglycan hydrolase-like protein with peptidoglycan-binding domain
MKTRTIPVALALALIAAGCGGGTGSTTSSTAAPTTSSSTVVATTTTTTEPATTTTTQPASPTLAEEGDVGEVVAQLQWLVGCGGFGGDGVTGMFDAGTAEAVMAAQTSLGFEPDAIVSEDFFIALTQLCFLDRPLEAGSDPIRVFGFTALEEPEVFSLQGVPGSLMKVTVVTGPGALVTVFGPSAQILIPSEDGTITFDEEGTHRIEISTAGDPEFFTIDVEFEFSGEAGDWIITTDGIAYRDTEFLKGTPADEMIEDIFDILGHGPRSGYGEFDTGWDDPGQEGFRGVFIEGLAFLFIGPNAENPGRPKTFWRVRYVGESYDANGLPRPYGWVQTLSGITVGDTLEKLIDTYGSNVSHGSNSEEHYYRYGAADGSEVCFYFGASNPEDDDVIVEISTECRD